MSTLRQAVETLRKHGTLPLDLDASISLRHLHQRFEPTHSGSTRILLSKIFGSVSTKTPWAIILCKFKGDTSTYTAIENFIRAVFTPGTGGMMEYWRDVSLGDIDITGSFVFNWVELDISRQNAGGIGRRTLIDKAIEAARRVGHDPITGFHSQIAVLTHNCSQNMDDNNCRNTMNWIDGSSDGKRVSLPPELQSGTGIAHEMGHGFGGMRDDFGYWDPYCIMSIFSTGRPFVEQAWSMHPTFNIFGPAICLPHLLQRGWMYSHRVYYDDGDWLARPYGITLPLAAITDPGARANLGIKLAYIQPGNSWDYYLEYVRPTFWNKGIGNPVLVIRRISPGGETSMYLGSATPGTPFIEQTGNVRFQANLVDAKGRIIEVTAKKL